ncbi:MAG: DUF3575 domain-containing protein [Bacteroides sp.]|nr:DUF3575 domain-containing protein [Bacteroides sp.]
MKTRILLILCILLSPVVCAQPAGYSVQDCDSLCRNPLLLYFRFDRSLVEYDYMDNPRTLREFDILFSDSTQAERIDTVTIISYSSPDGDARYNSRLSAQRAVSVKGYLIWKYPNLSQHRIVIRPQGENWAGLRQLVEADADIPDREEVLSILKKTPDTARCKILLRRLNRGLAYRYIVNNLLRQLRNAAVCQVQMQQSETISMAEDIGIEEPVFLPTADYLSSGVEQRMPSFECNKESEFLVSEKKRSQPIIALKTNLLDWAGATPDGKLAAFRPNLAAEVFFARRWSVDASVAYSHWQGGKGNKFWGVSGYSLEPRFWFNGDGIYHWFYLGAYGQTGDFDYRPHPAGDAGQTGASSTGTYWSTGLSLGIYVPLTHHWGVEAGLRGGYRRAAGKAYDN